MNGPHRLKAGRSCGTCRDRRIRCDRRVPACAKCGLAGLQCQGYGLRLSWPREGDGKRALSAPGPCSQDKPNVTQPEALERRLFVNMKHWHVASWYDAASSDNLRTTTMQEVVLQNEIPKTISLALIEKDDTNLLHYYLQNAGYFLLNPLGSLAQLLLQIGLTDSSPSSAAVLSALLAVSALHVSGESRAITFKAKAIAMTRASLSPDSPDSVLIGNIAASMLLYLYETLNMSSPLAWAVYLFGVKEIIVSWAKRRALSDSYDIIFDWVLYHETIIEFSQLYWVIDPTKPLCRNRTSMLFRRRPELCRVIKTDVTGCEANILDTIWKIFKIIMPEKTLPPSSQKDLVELEGQLRMRIQEPLESCMVPGSSSWMHAITILHCLATLLWINRAAMGYCGTEATHQALVAQAVEVLAQLGICDLPWPLFIIAGETRSDEQRCVILSVIHRTKERSKTKHMSLVEGLIEMGWNYDDLDPDGLLSYDAKLCSIIQTCPWMPPFI